MDHNAVKVGIVGLGYVGLPLAVAFCEAGHEVVGVGTDPCVVEALSRGESHVEDVPAESLRAAGDGFRASTRYADLAKVDAVVVAVPTPLTRNREPDLGPLVAAGTSLASVLQAGRLVVLESTTYHDDYVPEMPELGLRTEWPDDADCTAIVTAHPDLDVERIVRESPLVVDFRGVTRGIEAPKLVRL